jgi:uncharacterized protein involved in exopolysaccharide biosynthesis
VRNGDNPQLQEKKSKLLELELKRTELLVKFQPSYRLVQEVDDQIAQAKSAIAAEDLQLLRDELTEQNPEYEWASAERLKGEVEQQSLEERHMVTRVQVARYQLAAEKLGEIAVTQDDLERKLKAADDKYLLYANEREEARIGDALDDDGILNVALAEEPRASLSRDLAMGRGAVFDCCRWRGQHRAGVRRRSFRSFLPYRGGGH